MITGKNSALIGFGLFIYTLVTILSLIGCCETKVAFFVVVGILNLLLNGWVITSVYKYFSNKE